MNQVHEIVPSAAVPDLSYRNFHFWSRLGTLERHEHQVSLRIPPPRSRVNLPRNVSHGVSGLCARSAGL